MPLRVYHQEVDYTDASVQVRNKGRQMHYSSRNNLNVYNTLETLVSRRF